MEPFLTVGLLQRKCRLRQQLQPEFPPVTRRRILPARLLMFPAQPRSLLTNSTFSTAKARRFTAFRCRFPNAS